MPIFDHIRLDNIIRQSNNSLPPDVVREQRIIRLEAALEMALMLLQAADMDRHFPQVMRMLRRMLKGE